MQKNVQKEGQCFTIGFILDSALYYGCEKLFARCLRDNVYLKMGL